MSESDKRPPGGVSRRGFLKGVGATSVAAGGLVVTVSPEEAKAADPNVEPVGPGEFEASLNINGRDTAVTIEPRSTLLDVLRNRVDLTGAKKVCDRGTCGACTVLLDGHAVYACSKLAIDCLGARITTVEGLGSPDDLHPVQKAFIHNDAQQCGFCTPGFIVACAAVLDENPNPSAEQVRDGLCGNLCRCGTYEGIKAAMVDASVEIRGGG